MSRQTAGVAVRLGHLVEQALVDQAERATLDLDHRPGPRRVPEGAHLPLEIVPGTDPALRLDLVPAHVAALALRRPRQLLAGERASEHLVEERQQPLLALEVERE